MPESDATQGLALGRLLRMRAMVMEAAQIEATFHAGGALVRAYLGLRDEMLRILEPEALAELREEFERLFPVVREPRSISRSMPNLTRAQQAEAASEAQLSLRKLQGWIQGLIDELTFEERLRLEAEARVAQANRPMGFQP